MSVRTESREIDGLKVIVTQLPAMRAFAVFARMGKILGPALSELSGVGMGDLQNLGGKDIGVIGPFLSKLTAGLADDLDLALEVLKSVEVVMDGKKFALLDEAAVNRAFSGRFMAMLATLKFALEVNFADFLGDKLAGLQEETEEKASE